MSGSDVMSGVGEATTGGQTATTGGQALLRGHPIRSPFRFFRTQRPSRRRLASSSGGKSRLRHPSSTPSTEQGRARKCSDVRPSYRRSEFVGFSITVVGILLALFLLYLYVFSGLTGARNQNQLLHSVTSNPRAVFSLATGGRPRTGRLPPFSTSRRYPFMSEWSKERRRRTCR